MEFAFVVVIVRSGASDVAVSFDEVPYRPPRRRNKPNPEYLPLGTVAETVRLALFVVIGPV
jgi:hypothetical protein